MKKLICMLQLFAEVGDVVNALGGYNNAYTGATTPFTPGSTDLTSLNRTFFVQDMLDNTRDQMIYGQLGMKQTLPANHGTTLQWDRWQTLGRIGKLKEGVIPTGKKMGLVAISVTLAQYGDYVTVSDLSKKHGVHPIVLGAEEELSASYALTSEELTRNTLIGCTNILFADAINRSTGAYVSTPTTEAGLQTALATYNCNVTGDVLAKASTQLMITAKMRKYEGQYYLAVVHPHVAEDIRRDNAWIEAHKYMAAEEIFSGEIGRMHGIRFVVSNLAPVIKSEGQSYATYKTLIFAKDAFAVVDPEGGNMQLIIKNENEIGGALNQFGTVGVKGEMACKILYQERMLAVWSGSSYSGVAEDNLGLDFYNAA